jgi:hypothetical protein
MSAQGYQRFIIDNAGGIRLGFSLMAIGSFGILPFSAAVTSVMLRMEGPRGPLAYTQLVMGALGVVAFMVPLFPLAVAAYRPHSSPELIRMLNDMFWVPYLMAIWPFAGQAVAMGVLALRNDNPLPRWFGFACIWCAIGLLPTVFLLSFKTGPLASNGILGLWVPGGFGYIWYMISLVVFHRVIRARAEPEGRDPRGAGAPPDRTPSVVDSQAVASAASAR